MALFDPSPGTPACAPPGWHPRQSGRVRRKRSRFTPRGKFFNSSARRSNCFPLRSERRHDQKKAPVKTLEARGRRSPLTTWRMSRIAKGSYCRARCSQKQALAQIAKSGGLRFRSELPAVLASGRAAGGWVPMLALSRTRLCPLLRELLFRYGVQLMRRNLP
jgi:hypothetical protein